MFTAFHKDFTLKDGTEVKVRLKSQQCYEFLLVSQDGKEDSFTWDAEEASDILDYAGFGDCERRRNEALQELWQPKA